MCHFTSLFLITSVNNKIDKGKRVTRYLICAPKKKYNTNPNTTHQNSDLYFLKFVLYKRNNKGDIAKNITNLIIKEVLNNNNLLAPGSIPPNPRTATICPPKNLTKLKKGNPNKI